MNAFSTLANEGRVVFVLNAAVYLGKKNCCLCEF